MKITLLAALFSLMMTMSGVGAGQEPAKPRVLFDGKTLEGWKPTDFRNAGAVEVVDGAIVLRTGRAMSGITTTRDDLPKTNYELIYEAKRIDGVDFFAAATFPVGPTQFITLVNGGWGGSVTGLSSLDGADASENETLTSMRYENGRWYRFRVWVTDSRIVVWIDEKALIDVDHAGRDIRTRLEVRANQPLGFATWNTSGAVRAIAVRTLSKAEIAGLPVRGD